MKFPIKTNDCLGRDFFLKIIFFKFTPWRVVFVTTLVLKLSNTLQVVFKWFSKERVQFSLAAKKIMIKKMPKIRSWLCSLFLTVGNPGFLTDGNPGFLTDGNPGCSWQDYGYYNTFLTIL